MKALILVLLISLSFSQDELYNKEVSEEYLNNVIGNMTELIKEHMSFMIFIKLLNNLSQTIYKRWIWWKN